MRALYWYSKALRLNRLCIHSYSLNISSAINKQMVHYFYIAYFSLSTFLVMISNWAYILMHSQHYREHYSFEDSRRRNGMRITAPFNLCLLCVIIRRSALNFFCRTG